jgi:nitroreductase
VSTWTRGEIEVVETAVSAAPSVHNTQPWTLGFHDEHGVSVFERLDRALPRHDPLGRDRLLSCGAALENVVLAMRILGWVPRVRLLPDPDRRDEVARADATTRREPSDVDLARYAAVPLRRSYRQPFAARPVSDECRTALTAAAGTDGVEVRAIVGDEQVGVLARVLDHAALVLKADRAYQRELSAWTAHEPNPLPGKGVAEVPGRLATLPWAGLVRRSTALPDPVTLAARLRRECLLVVETPDDGPRDQLRAGRALQATWLAATVAGLAGSLLTQPLHVQEVRAGLIEGLGLAGFPQAILRLGHPVNPRDGEEEPS